LHHQSITSANIAKLIDKTATIDKKISMETHLKKINEILDAISQDIADREKVADNAMHILEKLKPSEVEYKEANLQFSANSFVARYLKHIKDSVKGKDYQSLKRLEQLIRFHHFQQHAKGALDDHRDLSLGQATVAVILGGYVERFFEAS